MGNTANKNYIEQLFRDSINVMKTDEWHWPTHWDHDRKLRFLNDSLNYAAQYEYWEQAAIIRDVQLILNQDTDGTVSDHTK
jgi:hypothetical protein